MGVFLSPREQEEANNHISNVNRVLRNDPDARFSVCHNCRGTGLTSKRGDEYWDGKFCGECKGFSIKIEKSGIYSVCSKCKGVGRIFGSVCPKCEGYGHLDWLENITGIRNKK